MPVQRLKLAVAAVLLLGLLALSGAHPYDRLTWLLEVLPIIVVLPLLWFTRTRYPLTALLYAAIFLHAVVLMTGGAYVRGRRMLAFIVVCVVLAISATYELIEWGAALALGQGADEFLGTQGDVWDTQSDMFCALLGAITALLVFARLHDRQLQNLTTEQN